MEEAKNMFKRILLPLDGSALDFSIIDRTTLEKSLLESSIVANQAISIAVCIARNTGATIDLLEVMDIPIGRYHRTNGNPIGC
jgi:hypothetical protein